MNSIGTILKEARTKKSVTLEDVHTKIKIHPRVLQILEDGKFEKLPSPVFVKSFLRSYAEFLEVNPEDLIRAYEKEDRKEPEQIIFLKTPEERKADLDPTGKALSGLMAAGIAVLVLAGAWFVWHTIKPEKAVTAFFADHKKQKAAEKKEKREVRSASPSSSEAVKQTEAAAEESPKRSLPWLRSPEQGNFPKLSTRTPIELKVKATDNVWMKVTCDGKVLFQSILSKGASESWKAENEIEIWTGNSSNMEFWVNRQSIGSPGKGLAKKMSLTREGIKLTQKI